MRVLTTGAAAAALALMGTAGAHAQIFVEPAPAYVYSPAPTVVAPTVAPPTVVAPTVAPPTVVAPTVAPPTVVAPAYGAYAYVPAPTGSVVVNARTGRSCRVEPDGYRWCWTP
jgi:hypothetical protein